LFIHVCFFQSINFQKQEQEEENLERQLNEHKRKIEGLRKTKIKQT